MILVDFGHLSSRLLFVSIKQLKLKPEKSSGKIDIKKYENFFRHLLFSNIRYILREEKLKDFRDEIVICCEGKNNWRYSEYPEYKSSRKQKRNPEIDFEKHFEMVSDCINALKNFFPYKVIEIEGAEGDDVIASIVQSFPEKKKLIVSEDKDFKQLLKFPNTFLFRPMLKEFVQLSPEEAERFLLEHIIMGDESDNIPKIIDETELSSDFISFCKSKDIFVEKADDFFTLQISEKLISDFKKQYPEKSVFKKVKFGQVALRKFLETFKIENLDKNSLLYKNFKRNEKLIDFKFIPKQIRETIIKEYENCEPLYDGKEMRNYFLKHNLLEHFENFSSFIINQKSKTQKFDVFFD